MKKLLVGLLVILGVCFLPKVSLAADTVAASQATYKNQLEEYSKAAASFESDRQIYTRDNSETNFTNVITSAQTVLAARAQTMSQYCLYLLQLCPKYITNQIELAELTEDLQNQNQQFLALQHDFTQTATWYQADAQFAQIMASVNKTAYEAYAWIYWTQLNQFTDQYADLVTTQKERLIDEAATQILATQRRKIVEESERALTNIRKSLTTQENQLSTISSYDSYTRFAHSLDEIQSDLKTSLKAYAELE